MAKKQFKTESKRILQLMIDSIYTHREIFLRELISNASDATDKLYYMGGGLNRDDLEIVILPDADSRTLTISDSGCGMTRDELEKNLGTIAKSGTLDFKNAMDGDTDEELIGQFGVGFYAAFMVAKRVTVISRTDGDDAASRWVSDGVDGYTIDNDDRAARGTTIILELKDNTDEENYDEFLDRRRLAELVTKYSDYIRYPIRMEVETSRKKEDSEEWETVPETQTLNSMTPIWRRAKDEVSDDDLAAFYRDKFGDWEPPARIIHAGAEGLVSYKALLFIPSKAPYDYYTKDFQRGLQLYSNGVLIMDCCAELLPDHFGFVRGIVDTQDISLNISRETLQQNRQVHAIARGIERRIKAELVKMRDGERDKYDTFWKTFGLPIKFGVYRDFGAQKHLLSDLLMFTSLADGKLVTLDEYVDAMADDQSAIYFASGESPERIAALPQLELLRDKGYDLLCLSDDVDEFVLRVLGEHKDKPFKSASEDAPEQSDDEKKASDERNAAFAPLFDAMKNALGDSVSAVRLSARLKSSPACVTSEGGLSLEMERVLKGMPGGADGVKAERVLELNPDHAVFERLLAVQADTERLHLYARVIYNQSLIAAGLPIDDVARFTADLTELCLGS